MKVELAEFKRNILIEWQRLMRKHDSKNGDGTISEDNDWRSISLGFFLARGLTPEEADYGVAIEEGEYW